MGRAGVRTFSDLGPEKLQIMRTDFRSRRSEHPTTYNTGAWRMSMMSEFKEFAMKGRSALAGDRLKEVLLAAIASPNEGSQIRGGNASKTLENLRG